MIIFVCDNREGGSCCKLLIATFMLMKAGEVCTGCSYVSYSVKGPLV